MRRPALSTPTRLAPVVALLTLAAALAFPSVGSALTVRIANEGGRSAEDVYVTVEATGAFNVPGMANNEPVRLSEIPAQTLTVNELGSGRIYVSYGAGVTSTVPFDSPTRFDWAELTVTPSSSDVANLTAVDQFGIGMRLDTFNGASQQLETVGDANSDTIFEALQQIPGGPQATVRGSSGEILRVLSPLHTSAYPDLGEYVRSMSGQTVTLHTAFFGKPFTTTEYTGTFAADGSITLIGTTNPAGMAPPTISFQGSQLIESIYTGAGTPNDTEGAIRRDVLAGFSAGFWDGRYGNDSLSFCSNPMTTAQGSWCPNGFNQPAFGDARASLSPFPTCEQYAAVVNQYTDVYGNPYSDASKKVTVSLDQPVSGGSVETLQLTILPDSGNAQPVSAGNSDCGAAGPAPAAKVGVRSRIFKRARVRGSSARVARLTCSIACGRVRAIARRGHEVLGRKFLKRSGRERVVALRLTKRGRKMLARAHRLRVRLDLWVRPAGQPSTHVHRSLILLQAPHRRRR